MTVSVRGGQTVQSPNMRRSHQVQRGIANVAQCQIHALQVSGNPNLPARRMIVNAAHIRRVRLISLKKWQVVPIMIVCVKLTPCALKIIGFKVKRVRIVTESVPSATRRAIAGESTRVATVLLGKHRGDSREK